MPFEFLVWPWGILVTAYAIPCFESDVMNTEQAEMSLPKAFAATYTKCGTKLDRHDISRDPSGLREIVRGLLSLFGLL
jgi:hypothetical protein